MGVTWKSLARLACKARPIGAGCLTGQPRQEAKKTATEVTVFYDTAATITEQPADRCRTLYSSGSRSSLRDLCQHS